jgi:prepilin-type N-terminal cleavage/methylation domain-containing protein
MSMVRNRGFTLIELVMILLILVVLSVVAVPRYINMQREVQESGAQEFMCNLNSDLAAHISEHYVKGTEWVKNGEELMGLGKEGPEMPEGMTYENDTWTVCGAGMSWKFEAAADPSPRGIVRVK